MRQEKTKKASNLYRNWGMRANAASDMFGPAKEFSAKALNKLKLKRRTWQIISVVVTVLALVFLFSVSPQHLNIKLPLDEDLLATPLLRGQSGVRFDLTENTFLKLRIIEFMKDSCDQFSYDMLFCSMVLVNEQAFQEPCFVLCKEKQFIANPVISKTEEEGTIECTERYATTQQTIRRDKHVVFTAERFALTEPPTMEDFTLVPKTELGICLYQHAVDIIKGVWIDK